MDVRRRKNKDLTGCSEPQATLDLPFGATADIVFDTCGMFHGTTKANEASLSRLLQISVVSMLVRLRL